MLPLPPILLATADPHKLHYLLTRHHGSAGLKALVRELGLPLPRQP